MDKHTAAELIRQVGRLIDDDKVFIVEKWGKFGKAEEQSEITWRQGRQDGLRKAIGLIQQSVDSNTKNSTADVLQVGGWFYFVGTISGIYATAVTGAHYIYIPKPIDQTADPVIPFWGEWLQPHRFDGDWYGPISPPV